MNSPVEAANAVAEHSVYSNAEVEQDIHKWIESEKARCDLGHAAVRNWNRSYWLHFYRSCFVKHVRGQVRFREFHPQTFNIVNNRLSASPELLEVILDMVREGAENLPLIWWAFERQHPMDQVIEILEALDINSQRLAPPRDSRDS